MERKMVVFLLFITGSISGWSQIDSVGIRNDSTEQVSTPVAPGHTTPQLKDDEEPFSSSNSSILKPEEVPPSLLTTLEDPIYAGWREGVIRRHMETGEFEIEILKDTERKKYRFNKDGERVPEE